MKYLNKSLFLLGLIIFMTGLSGQDLPEKWVDKLSPNAHQALLAGQAADGPFYVVSKDLPALKAYLRENNVAEDKLKREFPRWNGLLLDLPYAKVQELLLPSALVTFVDIRDTRPRPERAVRGLDLSTNKLNLVHHRLPHLNGEGLAISIKENAFDSTDIDLQARYLPSPLRDIAVTNHANNVATMAAGAGNSFFSGKGAAWGTRVATSSFFNIFPDEARYFADDGISVQNHSYGVEIENYYGGEAVAYDEQVARLGTFQHVFSAGNQGEMVSAAGPYQGIAGYANLTGNMKMAKNLLVVGAVDTALMVSARSSRGPAYDGRIKPELVAFGQDGSSGAAAITSGSILLLQQAYLADRGELPPAGLLRAALLNSADDLGAVGPDFISGYGNLDAFGAVNTLLDRRYFSDTIIRGEARQFSITLPENALNLKATLAWIDPPAAPNASKALLNDLDLSLLDEAGNVICLPWVLNTFPHPDSLGLAAVRGRDSLNNQEQIRRLQPGGQRYTLVVRGHELMTDTQEFHLAYEWDTPDFRWNFPLRNDPLPAGQQVALRWENATESTGRLEYQFIGAEGWATIAPEQNLATSFRNWTLPDTSALARFRVVAGANTYLSDTVAITRLVNLEVVYDCEEELGLAWESQEGVSEFRLYGLEDGRMEVFATETGNFTSLDKRDLPSTYLSIAPRISEARFGLLSPTINLAFQAEGCYVQRFLADLQGEGVNLSLTLGSLYQVERIIFEKWDGAGFIVIGTIEGPGTTELSFVDTDLRQGPNTYRARVVRANDRESFSDQVSIIFPGADFFVYPNPASSGEGTTLLLKELPPEATFSLFSSNGRLLIRFPLRIESVRIPTDGLKSGLYFYRVTSANKIQGAGKLIIR